MTANVRMPDLGHKLHMGRSKWIIVGDFDVDGIGATFIGCSWRPWERASKMREIITTVQWFSRDLRLCVGMNVGDLFGDTPRTIARHRKNNLGKTGSLCYLFFFSAETKKVGLNCLES